MIAEKKASGTADKQTTAQQRSCGFCYVPLGGDGNLSPKTCGGCNRRVYCSPECQRADWKPRAKGGLGQGHKTWCKLGTGEQGADWDVRFISDDKGYGLIAKRTFEPGERILVERTFCLEELLSRPSLATQLDELMPANGSPIEKISLNAVGNEAFYAPSDSSTSEVALRLSRANHACASNASHYYEANTQVKILVADRAIAPGEEICIAYVHALVPASPEKLQQFAPRILKTKWNIVCPADCPCLDPEVIAAVSCARRLDAAVKSLLQAGHAEKALRSARALIAKLETMPAARVTMGRAFFDAFQAAAARGDRATAVHFARRAHAVALDLGPQSESALLYEACAKDPTCYPCFGMCRN